MGRRVPQGYSGFVLLRRGVSPDLSDQRAPVTWWGKSTIFSEGDPPEQRNHICVPRPADAGAERVANSQKFKSRERQIVLPTIFRAKKRRRSRARVARARGARARRPLTSADDLPLSLLVFQVLEGMGIPRDDLAFALCRVLSRGEEKFARSHLASAGYRVLEGAIFEHLKYREAMKMGRSIGETGKRVLDARVDALIGDLLDQAALRAEQSGRRVA